MLEFNRAADRALLKRLALFVFHVERGLVA